MCRQNSSKHQESSSEDEFEKEMNAELNGQVKEIERKRGSISGNFKNFFHIQVKLIIHFVVF